MMDTGKTTKLMDSANILTLTEPNTRDTGLTTSNMAREKNTGQMVLNMKETISMARRMEWASSIGLINHLMREIS